MRKIIGLIVKNPLFSGSMIMVGGNMLANVVNYIYHLVMGRILGPTNYGVLASLYSVIYLIGIIPNSASISIVKFISSSRKAETYSVYLSIRRFVILIATLGAGVLILFSPFISSFLKIYCLSAVFILAPIFFFSLSTLVNQATAQGLLKFWGNVIPVLISSILKFAIGVILILLGWSVFGAMFGILVGLFFAYLFSRAYLKNKFDEKKFKKYDLKPFLRYSFPVLLQALAFTSLFSTDVILVKHFFDPYWAGIYAALSTLGKIIFFALSPITSTMFPIVAQKGVASQKRFKVFSIAATLSAVLGIAIVVFYWLFPQVAIGALYGKEYLVAAKELAWMGLFIFFYSLASLIINYSLSLGKTKIIAFPLVAAFIQIVAIWFFHASILMVIQISLIISVFLFLGAGIFLRYNRLFYENVEK